MPSVAALFASADDKQPLKESIAMTIFMLLLHTGNDFNLHQGTFRQCFYCDSRTGWIKIILL